MDDDNKSMMSQSSSLTVNTSQGEAFSKMDEVIFSFFYPLYNQPKYPSRNWAIVLWVIQFLQLFSLAFFRTDPTTYHPTAMSYLINFVDFTSLSYILAPYIMYVAIGCFAIQVILLVYLAIVAVLFSLISSTQPWIIKLLRRYTTLYLTILYIPLITMPITTFDCYSAPGKPNVMRFTNELCLSTTPQILGFVIAVIHLLLLLILSFFLGLVIFPHNPKHGGLWSSVEGTWQSVRLSMIFGLVFAMRMLWDWPFWRGFVTVGTSLCLCFYFCYFQPCYNLAGNVMNAIPFAVFGCLRLCLEIGYAIENASGSIVPTIVFAVLGVIGGIVCSFLCYKFSKKRRDSTILIHPGIANPYKYPGGNTEGLSLPKFKKEKDVEMSLRFLMMKDGRQDENLDFSDYVFTSTLKIYRTNPLLNFCYGLFLDAYKKNWMKAQTVFRKSLQCSPNFILRFVLFCKMREANKKAAQGMGGSELNNVQFTALFNKAVDNHQNAKDSLRDFYDNITHLHPDYSLLPSQLTQIVKSDANARKAYEDLIASYPRNTAVLRNYARLLLDIYNDEDTADVILTRADQFEEEGSVTSMGLPTNAGTIPEEKNGGDNGKKGKNDIPRASTPSATGLGSARGKGGMGGAKGGKVGQSSLGQMSWAPPLANSPSLMNNNKGSDNNASDAPASSSSSSLSSSSSSLAPNNNNNNNNNILTPLPSISLLPPSSSSSDPSSSSSSSSSSSTTSSSSSSSSSTPDSSPSATVLPPTVVAPTILPPKEPPMPTIAPASSAAMNEGSVPFLKPVSTPEQNMRWNAPQSQRSHASRASRGSRGTSNTRNRKKKKKRADTLVTELAVGNEGDAGINSTVLTWVIIIIHIFVVIFLIVGLVLYIILTNSYAGEMSTLEHVCSIVASAARSSLVAAQYFQHDIYYGYGWEPNDDGWASVLADLNTLRNLFVSEAKEIAAITRDIYGLTSDRADWEGRTLDIVKFTTEEDYADPSLPDYFQPFPPGKPICKIVRNEVTKQSLLDSLSSASSMMQQIGAYEPTDDGSSPPYASYFEDILYLMTNGVQPIVDGAKKAILSFLNQTEDRNTLAEIIYIIVVTATISLNALVLLIVEISFTYIAKKERMNAYYNLLDIPKQSLQAAIRRLVDSDKDDNDMNSTMQDLSYMEEEGEMEDNDDMMFEGNEGRDDDLGEVVGMELNEKEFERIVDEDFGKDEKEDENEVKPNQDNNSSQKLTPDSNERAENSDKKNGKSGDKQQKTNEADKDSNKSNTSNSNGDSSKSSDNNGVNENKPNTAASTAVKPESATNPSSVPSIPLNHVASLASLNGGLGLGLNTGLDGVLGTVPGSPCSHSLFIEPNLGLGTTPPTTNTAGLNGLGTSSSTPLLTSPLFQQHQLLHSASAAQIGGLQTLPSLQNPNELGFLSSRNCASMVTLTPLAQPSPLRSMTAIPGKNPRRSKLANMTTPQSLAMSHSHLSLQNNNNNSNNNNSEEEESVNENNLIAINTNVPPPQKEKKTLAEMRQEDLYDDENEEQMEAMIGYVRDAVEDNNWVEKFEAEIQKLNDAHKSLPSPINLKIKTVLIISVLILFLIAGGMCIGCVLCNNQTQIIARNIFLSGMRMTVLMQIKFIVVRATFPIDYLTPTKIFEFEGVTNPVWKDSSHMSHNVTELINILSGLSAYFQALHMDCHYGDSEYAITDDYIFDNIDVGHLSVSQNAEYLLEKRDCFITNGSDCEELDEKRLYGRDGEIYGLSELIARMRIGILRLTSMLEEEINENVSEARFISNAISNDLKEGIALLTSQIMIEGQNSVKSVQVIMIILTVVTSLVSVASFFLFTLQWQLSIKKLRTESGRMMLFLPEEDRQSQLRLMDSMRTGYARMDTQRENLLESCRQLLEAVRNKEGIVTITQTHKLAIQTALRTFTDEETDMEQKGYAKELIEEHKKEHILLRQRLTLIGDTFKQETHASTSVALRYLISLFDQHFTDDDIRLGTFLLQMDKKNTKSEEGEDDKNL